ncbi:MAG: protein-ADP-ribose hydrolase [Bifidobacteriaceae bacterium]|nr:protein-ADP-ribose hydrolase [Bifidobacteriaceae bacterium]
MNNFAQRLIPLVRYLADEREHYGGWQPDIPTNDDALHSYTGEQLWQLFRAYVNTREPIEPNAEWLAAQDSLLHDIIAERGIVELHDHQSVQTAPIDSRLRLFRGDITAIRADAIVNAANSEMLGCWAPGHWCIDNAIHTYAGVELRLACNRLMEAQGHPEPTGEAKVTPGFNLPAKYVIHTVGPIADGRPNERARALLASSYRSCLDAAARLHLRSIVFCCISTGVFGFPQEEAARIAVRTVRAWLDAHTADTSNATATPTSGPSADSTTDTANTTATIPTVVFDVFGATDEAIYRNLLGFDA